jgi:hypothetical protein
MKKKGRKQTTKKPGLSKKDGPLLKLLSGQALSPRQAELFPITLAGLMPVYKFLREPNSLDELEFGED